MKLISRAALAASKKNKLNCIMKLNSRTALKAAEPKNIELKYTCLLSPMRFDTEHESHVSLRSSSSQLLVFLLPSTVIHFTDLALWRAVPKIIWIIASQSNDYFVWPILRHLYCAVRVLWFQTDYIPNKRVVGTDILHQSDWIWINLSWASTFNWSLVLIIHSRNSKR